MASKPIVRSGRTPRKISRKQPAKFQLTPSTTQSEARNLSTKIVTKNRHLKPPKPRIEERASK